jgi:hypothetical protein
VDLFSETIIFLETMQVIESIRCIKAVRNKTETNPEIPDTVPFALKNAYLKQSEQEKSFSDSLSGKEFLVAFDDAVKVEELWIDTPLFRVFNKLREELARRQNFGRGLPIQMDERADSYGQTSF